MQEKRTLTDGVIREDTDKFERMFAIWHVFILLVSFIYWFYYKKFRVFIYDQPEKVIKGKVVRGKCPPAFPNGWFWLIDSKDLKRGEAKFVKSCGREVVVFRGLDNKVYVLSAYCAHIGANLGVGGRVRHVNCIECPFHGWLYDGKTGKCVFVDREKRIPRKFDSFTYTDINHCSKSAENLQKVESNREVELERFESRELNGSIFAWFHADEKYRLTPSYELFDITMDIKQNKMEGRGESINYVNCHIQDLPENGSDVRHFEFLHESIIDWIPFLKFEWNLLAENGDNPELREIMKHTNPQANAYKNDLFDRFLNENNRRFVNVMSLDCSLKVLNRYRFFVFNTTGFQLGPSIVYLFLWSPYFKLTFFHTLTPLEKFHQRVVHRISTSRWIPYWLSSLMLMGEVKQLYSDMMVWNNKVFSHKPNLNMKSYADQRLVNYRNWYSQFYEKCADYEKDLLSW